MGNLTPGISKDVEPSTHDLILLVLSGNTDVSVRPLSVEWISSGAGPFICPSEIHCTHVLSLQVAVVVGLEGDPLGRKVLGLLVSVVSASGTTGVVVTTEVNVTGTSFSFLPQTSDDIPIGPSVVLPLFLSFTVAKNC